VSVVTSNRALRAYISGWLEAYQETSMNKPSERKTKTTITSAHTPEKSTARWEMSDEEIWGMEAYQVILMNKPSERKTKTMAPGVDRAAAQRQDGREKRAQKGRDPHNRHTVTIRTTAQRWNHVRPSKQLHLS
jgi:hypothetical protein